MRKQIVIDNEIELKFLDKSMAEDIFSLIDSQRPYLKQWFSWVCYTKDIKDTKIFINKSLEEFERKEKIIYAINFHKTFVGLVSFYDINLKEESSKIGYWIAQEYQGKGIITKTCEKLLKVASISNIHNISIHVASENLKSIKVCQRLGFKLEKTIYDESINSPSNQAKVFFKYIG